LEPMRSYTTFTAIPPGPRAVRFIPARALKAHAPVGGLPPSAALDSSVKVESKRHAGPPGARMSLVSSTGAAAAGRSVCAVLALIALAATGAASAAPKGPLEVPKKKVLVTTTMDAGGGLTSTLTEYFTGDKSEKTGINLLLGIYRVEDDKKTLIATRDYNAQAGGYASRGALQLVDLDRDGTKEILVEYHHNEQPGSMRVELDVMKLSPGGLVLAWTGPVRVDTMAKDLGLQPADREKFTREIGYLRTAVADWKKIYFKKTVFAAAGVTFDPPRIVEDEFDLAAPPSAPAGGERPAAKE